MKTVIIIPARLESRRFPGKVLEPINGVPMLVKVYDQAMKVQEADNVYVAAPEDFITSQHSFFYENQIAWIKTSDKHRNGTERVAEAARLLSLKPYDLVINLQADMPEIDPDIISKVINKLKADCYIPPVSMVTAVTRRPGKPDPDPNTVKVILDNSGKAIYFTRQPAPTNADFWYKHIGVYGFCNFVLQLYAKLEQSQLEQCEDLEQLRFTANSFRPFETIITDQDQWTVNVPADLSINWPQGRMVYDHCC